MNILHLEPNKSGRRTGLTRGGHQGGHLLKTLNSPTIDYRDDMPSRPSARGSKLGARKELHLVPEDEDIERPPDSSEDEDEDIHKGDIIPTIFKRGSEKPKPQTLNSGYASSRGRNTRKATVQVNPSLKSTRKVAKPASSKPSATLKRTSHEEPVLGKGHQGNIFGWTVGSAKRYKPKTTYGLSGKTASSLSTPSRVNGGMPILSFYNDRFAPPQILDFDSPQKLDTEVGNSFRVPDTLFNSPVSKQGSPSGFQRTSNPSSSASPPVFDRKYKKRQIFSSSSKEDDEGPAFKKPSFDGSSELEETEVDNLLPSTPTKLPTNSSVEIPATQLAFRSYDINEVTSLSQAIVDEDDDELGPPEAFLDDNDETMTQLALCPMCNQPVNPDDLKSFGNMNTRMQEKFCRMHKRKTAEEEWKLNEYPEIDWKALDSRVSKHHKLINKLIKGQDSHYRRALEKKVDAGQDRTLLKMTSNLTPGYYGGRGLRAISENIMDKFTPLLKKRMVKDRLMSARGFTGYVQAVLVPEVAVLLIMEDMKVDVEEGMKILECSAGVGELLSEELRDVVKKRVADSEDDEEDELAD